MKFSVIILWVLLYVGSMWQKYRSSYMCRRNTELTLCDRETIVLTLICCDGNRSQIIG